MDNFTALIVPLEDHAEEVQRFRSRHVYTPGVRLPPHVSIIYPFVPVAALTEVEVERLSQLAERFLPFEYELRCTGSFPSARVLYLVPDPAAPFLRMFQALRSGFPAITPAFAEPVMHLTLAQQDPDTSVQGLDAEFHRSHLYLLPITTSARRLDLYEKKNGVWSFVKNCGGEANQRVDPTSVGAPQNPGGLAED